MKQSHAAFRAEKRLKAEKAKQPKGETIGLWLWCGGMAFRMAKVVRVGP